MKVMQLLGFQGPWWRQVFRDMDCQCCRSYGPIRVRFQASWNWQSEGLFGQSSFVAPCVQALRGLPSLGSFSVVQCIRCLMDQPLYCSTVDASLWGERGCGDAPPSMREAAVITLLPWLPDFPPQPFPTTISPLASPRSISPQSTAALALGLLHNP